MRFAKGPPPKPEHRINDQIRVRQVRLIDEGGAMVGVVPIEEALQVARVRGFDLVEVSPDARPPVCKILDYGKFKYEQKKKSRQSKKKHHTQLTKEVRLRPRTEEHDLQTKIKHAREFLEEGDKVLVTVFFKGREQAHKELGRALMARIKEALDEVAKVERDINMFGPRMQITLAPKPVSGKKPKAERAAGGAASPGGSTGLTAGGSTELTAGGSTELTAGGSTGLTAGGSTGLTAGGSTELTAGDVEGPAPPEEAKGELNAEVEDEQVGA